ncbi:Pentatricopeptide repeat-containing protein [Apostasia shenzhenica]|uniref:Pentatricopeptide repeat-containing protein n=1 Tax=Apostasia shenzhenica TaxID=1088818 RepID=A0A2I0BEZ3_9ASPA|nr:Pentatricopeptide repeat-containing protein [Apostasia shenzhenica]
MWAIRRASVPVRNNGCRILVARTCCAKFEAASDPLENGVQHSKSHKVTRSFNLTNSDFRGGICSAASFIWGRSLSSQAKANSSGKDEDELEDGFSDLEVPPEVDKVEELADKLDDESVSDRDDSDIDGDEAAEDALRLSEAETDSGEKGLARKSQSSPFLKIILDASRPSLTSSLDQWVGEGNPVGRAEISLALLNLRKRRLFGKALQFMEWLYANNHLEFEERDYASHIDLIAKVYGIYKAEKYIDKIPPSFQTEIIYRTLLANCVAAVNVKKAEETQSKMRDLGFSVTTFACNQLLLLYKRVDRKKIADVLKLMEKEDVKPSRFTYNLLIDTKGRMKDISGMEEVIKAMEAEGVEPDLFTRAMIARHYIFAGLNEKAEAALKEIEGNDISKNRVACRPLLPLYAALGKADDVGRVWKVCKSNPRLEECLAAIEAWGELGNVENAEEVFESMMKTWKKLSSKYYNTLLKVYARHKLLAKGKELAKRMSNSGCRIGPVTLDALVKLYVESGEVEKADSILQKASEKNQIKPLYHTYITVLDKYAQRGDIHNAEKIFHRMRLAGYVGRMGQYLSLLRAYINAKTPAYGFRERMKADNLFPNKLALAQLQAVDAFRKTEISELLD